MTVRGRNLKHNFITNIVRFKIYNIRTCNELTRFGNTRRCAAKRVQHLQRLQFTIDVYAFPRLSTYSRGMFDSKEMVSVGFLHKFHVTAYGSSKRSRFSCYRRTRCTQIIRRLSSSIQRQYVRTPVIIYTYTKNKPCRQSPPSTGLFSFGYDVPRQNVTAGAAVWTRSSVAIVQTRSLKGRPSRLSSVVSRRRTKLVGVKKEQIINNRRRKSPLRGRLPARCSVIGNSASELLLLCLRMFK